MATFTERLAVIVEANAGKAIAEFKQLGTHAKGLNGDVGKAGGLMKSLSGGLGQLTSGGLASGAAFAGAGLAIAKFVSDGVADFTKLVGEVAAFQRIAGGTTEAASKMVSAFKMVGVDAETAGTGIFMLEKHLASGASKLAAFGVTAVKDAKGNTDMTATLLSVGDAYKRIQDPVQRAALLTAAFGRSGTALLPLLARSRGEIQGFFDDAEGHHAIVTDADKASVKAYNLAIRDLSETWKGLGRELGAEVLPMMTTIAKDIKNIVGLVDGAKKQYDDFIHSHKGAKMTDPLEGVNLGQGKHGLVGDLIPESWRKELDDFGITSGFAAKGGNEVNGAFKDVNKTLSEFATKVVAVNTPLEEADVELDKLTQTLHSTADADHALAESQRGVTDAQGDLNKLLKEGAVDAEKVADAQRSLASANRSVGHALREQRKAQDEYNDAKAAAGVLGTDTANEAATEAADNLADANDSVADAQAAAAAAAADLRKAQAGDPDYQQKLADARQKVADATYNMSQRALADVAAHDAETKALSDNADQLQRLLDLNDALIKQHPEAALALAPIQTAIGAAIGASDPGPGNRSPVLTPPAPGGLLAGWDPTASPTTTTNHVTINAAPTADARLIAKEVMWNLN